MDSLQPKIGERGTYRYRRHKSSKQVENTKGKPPKGRNVGKLMQVLNVPVEVFLEIASHLQPLDLLHLARASLELRETLMSRKMRSVWIAARKNLDPPMPDCPEGMSEPAYASLVFEAQCIACGAGRASWKYSYAARVRFCGACWKANVRSGSKLAKEAGIKDDMSVLFNLLPAAHDYRVWGWQEGKLNQSGRNKFYEPEFLSVVERYKKIQSEGETKALQEFVAQRNAETRARLDFDSTLRDWQTAHSAAKDAQDGEVATERAAAIKQRLGELGYKSEDFPRWNSEWHTEFRKMLHQPRPLTTKIWNTICPKLIKIVEAERSRQQEEAFKAKWRSRLTALETYYGVYRRKDRASHPEKRTLPHFEVARKLPCMTSLLTAVENSMEDLTEEQFTAIEAALLQESEEKYCIPAKHFLAELVRNSAVQAGNAQPATSSKAKASKKAKAAVTKRKGKGKGKKRVVDEDSDSDVDSDVDSEYERSVDRKAEEVDGHADTVLLDTQTSLFVCRASGFCHSGCTNVTCNELLEHWQDCHGFPPWEGQGIIQVSSSEDMPRLVAALRLPPDATLSDIEELLRASSAAPQCSICNRFTRPDRTVSNLLRHISYCHPSRQPHSASADSKPGPFIDLGVVSSAKAASSSKG
ncbi:hypothetical protein OH76DRAFT_1480331 [Lentinus brumalis]|uniref:F-box domain-containing protein n=1 Tax=Lentinus brumalis TaxID=2498619 RepID=A0A371DJK5_9APHY|nr:hypothetical protein OH76DRAFT_1480331 [Polyporus brumalis]